MMWPVLWLIGAASLYGQTSAARFEASFSTQIQVTDGTMESTTFLRFGRPLTAVWVPEMAIGIDHRRKTASFLSTAVLRRDFAHPRWHPFVLAGGGLESVIVGPYLEHRPMGLFGTGALLSLGGRAWLRVDYQFQRIFGSSFRYTRHLLMAGVMLRWLR